MISGVVGALLRAGAMTRSLKQEKTTPDAARPADIRRIAVINSLFGGPA
jgi:hypothetical protein